MKHFLLVLLTVGCVLLFAASAMAATGNTANGNTAKAAKGKGTASDVPQAQIDTVKKREDMNKRREELLKLRQRLIQADDPGNVDGQHPVK